MGIIQRLSDALTGRRSEPLPGVQAPPRPAAAPRMEAADALTISSVYRAFQILSTSVMQLTLDVERGTETLALPSFMRKPDVDLPAEAFPELTVTSLASSGNAFWKIDRLPGGSTPLSITVLDPMEVFIHTDRHNPRKLSHYTWRGETIRPADMKHLALMRVPWRIRGLGPIEAARGELAGAAALRHYAEGWFDTSDVPSGVLSTDQQLNQEQAALIKALWSDTSDGGVRVLGAGSRYAPIMLNPKDAQWLEARSFTTTEISRLFGMPSSLMLATIEGNSSTYANVEQDWLAFTRFTLMRYLKEIEAAWTDLLPRGQRARFNVEGLLRTDTKSRYEAHAVGIQAGFLTINDVRRVERLPPLPGGDTPKPAPAPALPPAEKETTA